MFAFKRHIVIVSGNSINLKTEFNAVLETPLAMKTSEWRINHGLV